jgi:uncharacterized membrane protein
MDPTVLTWTEVVFRWTHVVAGVAWIGHLYFFNFVNGPLAKTYDADTKKKVVPELMPRALYWFRWGAAYTWITGILLAAWVYYMANNLVGTDAPLSNWAGTGVAMGILVVGFFLYDVLWKALAKQEMAGMVVSFLLVTGIAFGMSQIFIGRAVFIHVGMLFGTIMAGNVWMRIWPNQRRIIKAVKEGTAPDAALVALAGLRSKHNTYMSVPLVMMMVADHYPTIYSAGNEPNGRGGYGWAIAMGMVVVGWGVAKLLYKKSASAAPTTF